MRRQRHRSLGARRQRAAIGEEADTGSALGPNDKCWSPRGQCGIGGMRCGGEGAIGDEAEGAGGALGGGNGDASLTGMGGVRRQEDDVAQPPTGSSVCAPPGAGNALGGRDGLELNTTVRTKTLKAKSTEADSLARTRHGRSLGKNCVDQAGPGGNGWNKVGIGSILYLYNTDTNLKF